MPDEQPSTGPAPEPTTQNEQAKTPGGPLHKARSHFTRFKGWYASHRKLSIPATVLCLLIVILAIPFSRMSLLGLFMKEDVQFYVYSDKSGAELLGATVRLDGKAVSAFSPFTFHQVKLGRHQLSVSALNHRTVTKTQAIDITFHKPKKIQVRLGATGLLAQVEVINKISGQPVIGATVSYKKYVAKVDPRGVANLVVGVNDSKIKVDITAKGYNPATQQISASEKGYNFGALASVDLVPAGKVYFLSKLSGKIDVVKTNLDGSQRQTVIAGTGKEDDQNTVLLASRDWKYLALLSNRDGSQKLYVINTNDDNLITMDEGNASFTPIGWYNHYFMYQVSRNGYNSWQSNAVSIKSYNAETGSSATLVNTNATGTSNADAQYEAVGYSQIVGGSLVYTKLWYQYPGYLNVAGKQNVIASIRPDGSGAKQIKTVDSNAAYMSNLRLNKPTELDFGVYSINNSAPTSYWVLDKNGNVNQSTNLNDQSITSEANTYLASPSGSQTFWQEERDGKNTLLIGDQDGGGAKQIATLSAYSTYGWYSDNYLLVSKDADELYILPVAGIKDDSKAIKITDYHKPAQNFYGYGGGYGGL